VGIYNRIDSIVSGRKVRLRQIRDGVEQPPITSDNNYDFSYQEYRRLQNPVKVYPVSAFLHFLYGDRNTAGLFQPEVPYAHLPLLFAVQRT